MCCYNGPGASAAAIVVDVGKKELKSPEGGTKCSQMDTALKKVDDEDEAVINICNSNETSNCTGYCEYVILKQKITGSCKPGSCTDDKAEKCCLNPAKKAPLKSANEFEDEKVCLQLLKALNATVKPEEKGNKNDKNNKNNGSNVVHLSISVFSIISLIWLIFPF